MGLYFVKAEKLGLIKIGSTNNSRMTRTLGQLQPLSPDKLTIIGSRDDLGLQDKLVIQARLAAHKSHNDWFYPNPEVLEEIRKALSESYKISYSGVSLKDLKEARDV